MVFNFFKKKQAQSTTTPQLSLSVDHPIYAIGDIHGRIDLTKRIVAKIAEDIAQTQPENPIIVFLGDYIDRGEESAQVLAYLNQLRQTTPYQTYFLKGNHEAALLSFLESPTSGAQWLRFGGLQTLMSYQIKRVNPQSSSDDLYEAAQALREAMGDSLTFLQTNLSLSLQSGNVFFCHAAIDANLSLEAQPEETLLWGNDAFLTEGGGDKAWVIHGHTITPQPHIGYHRIGVDTGAYYSGKLTAIRLEGNGYRFLST